jgi:hypothetical protein
MKTSQLPCPFCKTAETVLEFTDDPDNPLFFHRCQVCCAQGPYGATEWAAGLAFKQCEVDLLDMDEKVIELFVSSCPAEVVIEAQRFIKAHVEDAVVIAGVVLKRLCVKRELRDGHLVFVIPEFAD